MFIQIKAESMSIGLILPDSEGSLKIDAYFKKHKFLLGLLLSCGALPLSTIVPGPLHPSPF